MGMGNWSQRDGQCGRKTMGSQFRAGYRDHNAAMTTCRRTINRGDCARSGTANCFVKRPWPPRILGHDCTTSADQPVNAGRCARRSRCRLHTSSGQSIAKPPLHPEFALPARNHSRRHDRWLAFHHPSEGVEHVGLVLVGRQPAVVIAAAVHRQPGMDLEIVGRVAAGAPPVAHRE